jgi:hypothetical protein
MTGLTGSRLIRIPAARTGRLFLKSNTEVTEVYLKMHDSPLSKGGKKILKQIT